MNVTVIQFVLVDQPAAVSTEAAKRREQRSTHFLNARY